MQLGNASASGKMDAKQLLEIFRSLSFPERQEIAHLLKEESPVPLFSPSSLPMPLAAREAKRDFLPEPTSLDEIDVKPEEQLKAAAFTGDVRRVATLINAGIKVDCKHGGEKTPLFVAAEAKDSECFRFLLAASENPAYQYDHYSIAEYVALISPWPAQEKQTIFRLLDERGMTLSRFHRAACLGDIEAIKKADNREPLEAVDGVSNTLATYASANGHGAILSYLEKVAPHLLIKGNRAGLTPLLFAARRGHLAIVQWLLQEGGARMTEASENGMTALSYAAHGGHFLVLKWLLRESRWSVRYLGKIRGFFKKIGLSPLASFVGLNEKAINPFMIGMIFLINVISVAASKLYEKVLEENADPWMRKMLLLAVNTVVSLLTSYLAMYKFSINRRMLFKLLASNVFFGLFLDSKKGERIPNFVVESFLNFIRKEMSSTMIKLVKEDAGFVSMVRSLLTVIFSTIVLSLSFLSLGFMSITALSRFLTGLLTHKIRPVDIEKLLKEVLNNNLLIGEKTQLALIQYLLQQEGVDVSGANWNGETVLLWAIRRDYLSIVRWLLFEYRVPCDKKFLAYIQSHARYQWLCDYLALADALNRDNMDVQTNALRRALDYDGEGVGILREWVTKLLLTRDCEELLMQPALMQPVLKEHKPFQMLWQHYTRERAVGTVLILSHIDWSVAKWHWCSDYLAHFRIKGLCISQSVWLSEKSWQAFLASVRVLPLVTLNLSHNGLRDERILQLAEALKANQTITTCILDRNKLSYRGLQAFLVALAIHPTLTTLSVRENDILETDKATWERNVGAILLDEKCHWQTIDISGNYLMSQGNQSVRVEALRRLLHSTRLTADEFSRASWVTEKESPKGKHFTVLSLKIDEKMYDVEVPMDVVDVLVAYGKKEGLGSDARRFNDLRSAVADTLRYFPELRPIRLSDFPAENSKEQKKACKQLLFFHPHAPLKSYLQSHKTLRCERLATSTALLSRYTLTSQEWRVCFIVKRSANPLDEHAMLLWEGIYSYGQRVVKVAHLELVKNGQGEGEMRISYRPCDIAHMESLLESCRVATFRVSKKRVKAMEILIDQEVGTLPGKYKMLLSHDVVSAPSKEQREKMVTNCQKWALEKLEYCLECKEGSLLKQMSLLPSNTVQKLWTADLDRNHVHDPGAQMVLRG